MNVRKHLSVVEVKTAVDGTKAPAKVRAPRKARTENVVQSSIVPADALQVALDLAGGDLSRLRPVPAPDAVGGVALVVYNTASQARRAQR